MNYQAGLYIRLSKEDKNESINNQKRLLTDYAHNMHYNIFDLYIDDGFTGTNFNRPNFQRLLNDIYLKKINMVIVKDLSRLGRDYIKTGELVEHFFPINNIRFIAITDNIDTFLDNSNNDIAPFKAIINDLYAKDISKKIRASFKTMRENGLWTGGTLPLGYTHCNKKIIIIETEAKIVQEIFKLFNANYTLDEIKHYLNAKKIPTFNKIRKNKISSWSNTTIKNILTNPIYTGNLVQNKHQRLSYKYRKIIKNPKESWIIKYNNHPAIINKTLFNNVQAKLKKTTRKDKKQKRLLDNLMYCQECGHHIGIRNPNNNNRSYMCCNYYRSTYKDKLCTAHAFNYDILEEDILNILVTHLKESKLINPIENIEKYYQALINIMIEKIEINQNKEVTIFFNFKNITK